MYLIRVTRKNLPFSYSHEISCMSFFSIFFFLNVKLLKEFIVDTKMKLMLACQYELTLNHPLNCSGT